MRILSKVFLISVTGLLLFACSESTSDDENNEFVAGLESFSGYTDWTLVDTQYGPDPLLQSAHGTNDGFVRKIFVKDNAQPNNGQYPTGTLIVKELRDFDGALQGALTMMAKRDGGFNPDGDGWEWFMTSTDLTSVITQGDNATAGGGMCASCHAGANTNNNGTNWVFNHPDEREFVATLSDFEGYQDWPKVATEFGPDPLLGAAHGLDDSLYRHIYVKDHAKSMGGEFLKRTMIVKELRDKDDNITGALTMLVKRGGNFNPAGNGWEWFMTSTDLTNVITQGDNATAGGGNCASCHAGANVGSNGEDWVFTQP